MIYFEEDKSNAWEVDRETANVKENGGQNRLISQTTEDNVYSEGQT